MSRRATPVFRSSARRLVRSRLSSTRRSTRPPVFVSKCRRVGRSIDPHTVPSVPTRARPVDRVSYLAVRRSRRGLHPSHNAALVATFNCFGAAALVRPFSEDRTEVSMHRELIVGIGILCLVSTTAIRGQSVLTIRAAATSPVSGWQQMASPDRDRILWVAPTSDLTSADIERAESVTSSDGSPALTIVFTDDGVKKMAALSATRLGQPIAFLLDGKLIWAPVVRAPIDREAVISGGPGGLTAGEVQRILAILRQR